MKKREKGLPNKSNEIKDTNSRQTSKKRKKLPLKIAGEMKRR